MPTNDSGYDLIVGPDADGKFETVPAGDDYTLPTPPKSVSDLEDDVAPAEDTETVPATAPAEPAPSDPLTPAAPAKGSGKAKTTTPDPAPTTDSATVPAPDAPATAPTTEGQ